MVGQTQCQPCIAGFECEDTGITLPTPCRTGHYCELWDQTPGVSNVKPCPAGTYSSNQYLTSANDCNPCQAGKYCESGSTTFTGYCASGYVCVSGSPVADPNTGVEVFTFDNYDSTNNGPCPKGHYCPYGSGYPRKCQSGQY
jgi:hypothetical protein